MKLLDYWSEWNMVISKYSFPLPNSGDKYDLSQNELIELLDNAYNCGFEHARDIYDPSRQGTITWASSEGIDDNTRWKEVWTK